MLNALLGGVTLLAIFLQFMNMGTTLGTIAGAAAIVGLLVKSLMNRARYRAAQSER
jgi:hypothetical protein